MIRKATAALVTVLLALAARTLTATADDAKLRAYGNHLSGECSACHRTDGIDNGIPSITGWDVGDFAKTLHLYRDGSRPNAAMISVARSLDDEQVKALAAYYGSLPNAPRRNPAPKPRK